MQRTKRLSAFLVFAVCLWGVSAWGQAPVKPPLPHYIVRYLCFTVTPKPGANFPEQPPVLPPVLGDLNSQYGWPVALTPDPGQFLARLRRKDSRYTYRLDLADQPGFQ